MNYYYKVIVAQEEDGRYSVHCPALKGCHSQGNTLDESLKNISEAMEGWLEVAKEHGDPIPSSDAPSPKSTVEAVIEVAA